MKRIFNININSKKKVKTQNYVALIKDIVNEKERSDIVNRKIICIVMCLCLRKRGVLK